MQYIFDISIHNVLSTFRTCNKQLNKMKEVKWKKARYIKNFLTSKNMSLVLQQRGDIEEKEISFWSHNSVKQPRLVTTLAHA